MPKGRILLRYMSNTTASGELMWLTRVPPEMANTGNREETDVNFMPKLNEHGGPDPR